MRLYPHRPRSGSAATLPYPQAAALDGSICPPEGRHPPVKYGYARVSADDQNADMQRAALKRAGCKKTFTDDGVSGDAAKRPALLRCLKLLKRGDTLVVWKLDRLSRSVRDFVIMAADLAERGIKLTSLSEHIDPATPLGRAMMQIAVIFAEMELASIRERTRAGVTAAKARGVKFGRKPKLTAQQINQARKLIAGGERPEDG